MEVKASLHLHSREDVRDSRIIDYSLYELIDRAAVLGFKVLASTCHLRNVCRPEHIEYAKSQGVLLIAGVEVEIGGRRHVLILNGGPEADRVATFGQLEDFKRRHPEAFVIAPHPNYFSKSITLGRLRRLAGVFDAAEHSWFYSRFFNLNRKAERLSRELGLPFIATADAHVLDYLDIDHLIIDVDDLSAAAVFNAIRQKKFANITQPKTIWEMIWFLVKISRK